MIPRFNRPTVVRLAAAIALRVTFLRAEIVLLVVPLAPPVSLILITPLCAAVYLVFILIRLFRTAFPVLDW